MKKSLFWITLWCLFSACERDYELSKFGPEQIIVPADFEVSGFTVSPSNSINLATQDANLNCTMSQRAEFKIVITGLSSGAEKILRGAGETIDADNSKWTGDSDNLYMFRAGEECSVELSFHGAIKKYYDTIVVTSENVYPGTVLVNSFEGFTLDKNSLDGVLYGNYLDEDDFAESDIRTDNTLKPCQGTQSMLYDCTDLNSGYYAGGMYFYPSGPTYVFSGYEPESLYFNAFVYSYGDNSAIFNFVFSEDDNGDNVADNVNDDTWRKEVPVDGAEGWKLVSFRLKDFTDDNPSVGNGTLNLNKIKGFNANFNVKVAGSRGRANLDYIIISYGKPFEP